MNWWALAGLFACALAWWLVGRAILRADARAEAQTFDVCDFGAVGDQVTDDRPAFRAAVAACVEAGGGVVVIPQGVYDISGELPHESPTEPDSGDRAQ